VAVENMDVVAGAHEVSTVMPLAHLPFAVLTAGEQQRPQRLPEVLAEEVAGVDRARNRRPWVHARHLRSGHPIR